MTRVIAKVPAAPQAPALTQGRAVCKLELTHTEFHELHAMADKHKKAFRVSGMLLRKLLGDHAALMRAAQSANVTIIEPKE